MSVTVRARTPLRRGITRVHLGMLGPVLRLGDKDRPPRHQRVTRPAGRIVQHAVHARIRAD